MKARASAGRSGGSEMAQRTTSPGEQMGPSSAMSCVGASVMRLAWKTWWYSARMASARLMPASRMAKGMAAGPSFTERTLQSSS